MARPKRTRIAETSPQPAVKRRRKSPNDISIPQAVYEQEYELFMESEQDFEIEEATPTPRLPQKRVVGARKRHRGLQKQEDNELSNITVVPRVSQPEKESSPVLKLKLPGELDRVVLKDKAEYDDFISTANESPAFLRHMKTLEIHIDTNNLVGYTEDRLALALNILHPRADDGSNPHDLQTLQIVVTGNLLLTRYGYHLVSPVLSKFVGSRLRRLIDGKLTNEGKKNLPYKINSTEKLLANALLGIHGVGKVSIEGTGKGTMEADFAATIKATLVQPLGTDILEASDKGSRFSTHTMNKPGPIYSDVYDWGKLNPYAALIPQDLDYDVPCLSTRGRLGKDRTQPMKHVKEPNDHGAHGAAVVEPRGTLRREPKVTHETGLAVKTRSQMRGAMVKRGKEDDGPVLKPTLWTCGMTAKQTDEGENTDEQIEEVDEEDETEGKGLGLRDMVRIHKKKVQPRDIDSKTLNTEVMSVVLTAKEEAIEMGWKV
jgi:hypothetical protein